MADQGVARLCKGVDGEKKGKARKIWDLPVEAFYLVMAFLPLRTPFTSPINWREFAHWSWAGWVTGDPGAVIRFLGLSEPMLWKWEDFRLE